MSGFPIGQQIKKQIQKSLFERIHALNRTDSNYNPLSTISDEVESNPYSQMLTKSCWVRVSSTIPTFKKEKDPNWDPNNPKAQMGEEYKFVRPLEIESEEPFQLHSDWFKEKDVLLNAPISSPTSHLRAGAGITGVTTSYKGPSIQDVTINWKLYNPNDFDVFEKAFLKHGRTVLVEFGWSVPGIEFNTVKEIKDMFSYYSSLEEKILQGGGNYFAAMGTIKNFSWNIGPAGEYDCTTTLTTMGNTLFKTTNDPTGNVSEVVKRENTKRLEQALAKAAKSFDKALENLENDIQKVYENPTETDKGRVFYNSLDGTAYCNWGWFEDKILTKYFGAAAREVLDEANNYKGLLTYVQSTDISYTDESGTLIKKSGPNTCRYNEKYLFTINTDIILPKKPIIGFDALIKAAGLPRNEDGTLTDTSTPVDVEVADDYLRRVNTFNSINSEMDSFKSEDGDFGIIRNFCFSAKFLREKFKGIRTLDSGLNGFWASVTGAYGGYWNFVTYQSPTISGKIAITDTHITKFRVKDINPYRSGNPSTYEDVIGDNDAEKTFVFPIYNNKSLFKDFSTEVNISSAMATQAMFHSSTDYSTSGFGGDGSPENKGVVALAKMHNMTIAAEQGERDALEDKLYSKIFFPFVENLSVDIETDSETGEITYELNTTDVKDSNVLESEAQEQADNAASLTEDRLKDGGARWLTADELVNPEKANLVFTRKGELLPSFVRGMQWYLNKGPDSKTEFDPLTPLQISFTMPGIAGIKMYDIFAVDYLPKLYREFGLFQVFSLDHTLSPQGWETKVSARLRVDTEGLAERAKELNFDRKIDAHDAEPTEGTGDLKDIVNEANNDGKPVDSSAG